jgi:hypothetical protein
MMTMMMMMMRERGLSELVNFRDQVTIEMRALK